MINVGPVINVPTTPVRKITKDKLKRLDHGPFMGLFLIGKKKINNTDAKQKKNTTLPPMSQLIAHR